MLRKMKKSNLDKEQKRTDDAGCMSSVLFIKKKDLFIKLNDIFEKILYIKDFCRNSNFPNFVQSKTAFVPRLRLKTFSTSFLNYRGAKITVVERRGM